MENLLLLFTSLLPCWDEETVIYAGENLNTLRGTGSLGSAFVPMTLEKYNPLERGVELVLYAFNDMKGGEIYVKKSPSLNICDIAAAVDASAELVEIGIRPGEKLHEQMIGVEDAPDLQLGFI